MAAAIRVHGLKELNAALRALDRKAASDLGNVLKDAAGPVAASARDLVSRYRGSSPGTIRPKRRGGLRVVVEQSKGKVTGLRGDFGALQMRTALIPALEKEQDNVLDQVERALNRWGKEEGF